MGICPNICLCSKYGASIHKIQAKFQVNSQNVTVLFLTTSLYRLFKYKEIILLRGSWGIAPTSAFAASMGYLSIRYWPNFN